MYIQLRMIYGIKKKSNHFSQILREGLKKAEIACDYYKWYL